MKKYLLIHMVVGMIAFTLSSCDIIRYRSVLGSVPPERLGSFAKPVVLKDTAQVANYIGGYIEKSSSRFTRQFAPLERYKNGNLYDLPNLLQGGVSFYQYRDWDGFGSMVTPYITYGGSLYGGVIKPKSHYEDFVFKKPMNPYANKYFVGINASFEFGASVFFNPNKTGVSFSLGTGFNIYYTPFGSLRELIDAIDVEEFRDRYKGFDDLIKGQGSSGAVLPISMDFRYTYPNRKGAVGLVAFESYGFIRPRGVSAYVNMDRWYLEAKLTENRMLNSPLISVGVQYQLSLKKKNMSLNPKKKKRSFWRRIFSF